MITDPRIVTIRIDESLTYLNARWLEEHVLEVIAERPAVRHLILMGSAIYQPPARGCGDQTPPFGGQRTCHGPASPVAPAGRLDWADIPVAGRRVRDIGVFT